MTRSTHTYVLMNVSIPVWEEVRDKLQDAGYLHVFGEHEGRPTADMQGIALTPVMPPPPLPPSVGHFDWTRTAVQKLLDVIREVHSQHADDLCWMPADVNKIFVAAGLPPQDLQVGDKAAMRKNCDRYIDCLASGGPWKSYAELEAELSKLRKRLASAVHQNANVLVRDEPPMPPRDWDSSRSWAKHWDNCRRAERMTTVAPITAEGWEKVAVMLMDEMDALAALLPPP